MTNTIFSITLEDLLHYGTGFILGISLVLWILRSIIPFGNQAAGGGSGILPFLLLFAIIAPILQDVLSTPTESEEQEEERIYPIKPDDDINFEIPERTPADTLSKVNVRPTRITLSGSSHPIKGFYVQTIYLSLEEDADQFAVRYNDINSRVVMKNGGFAVIVGGIFETESEAKNFMDLHKSILPDDTFLRNILEDPITLRNKYRIVPDSVEPLIIDEI